MNITLLPFLKGVLDLLLNAISIFIVITILG